MSKKNLKIKVKSVKKETDEVKTIEKNAIKDLSKSDENNNLSNCETEIKIKLTDKNSKNDDVIKNKNKKTQFANDDEILKDLEINKKNKKQEFKLDFTNLGIKREDKIKENLEILFWNAGGFNQGTGGSEKFIKFSQYVIDFHPDVFAIIDAGFLTKMQKELRKTFMDFYQLEFLGKGRQVSTGMIIGIKDDVFESYKTSTIKEMELLDKLEIFNVILEKENFKDRNLYFIYNPPKNNEGNFNLIEFTENVSIMGDFNLHHVNWGYKRNAPAAIKLLKLFESKKVSRVRSSIEGHEDDFTFKSRGGSKTNPDLVFCHQNLSNLVNQKPIGLIGNYDHKIIHVKIKNERIPFICACDKTFKSKSGLRNHQKKCTSCISKFNFKCSGCNKPYVLEKWYQKHIEKCLKIIKQN
ncbi:hypothetical protein PVAND_017207 [Polypedilum vanderplanki]|uniref:Endonuclease/exonuclease/phosphatase domain-containing protein n=1 Tax=Polypedilum vanderplanki TaxID=319348 RepID=A0A9J6BID0_POLVA|nr:hypothetical protein PVAND_017207 [Polypedilum vanderplanki]